MTIHFICKGNTFRSRLAEAYLNSKELPNIKAVSSGVAASLNQCGPVSWYAQRIIQHHHLIPYEKPVWDQTTRPLLEEGDFTVFMDNDVYTYCTEKFGYKPENFEVWDIKDTDSTFNSSSEEIKKVQFTEGVFEEIKNRINQLLPKLREKAI